MAVLDGFDEQAAAWMILWAGQREFSLLQNTFTVSGAQHTSVQ
jgi:hypothetical protein